MAPPPVVHASWSCWTLADGDRVTSRAEATTCRSCLWALGRLQRAAREAHRKPPRPPFQGQPGRCALCGTTELERGRRTWCSQECVDTWRLATDARWCTHQLLELHGRACWGCGQVPWYPWPNPTYWAPPGQDPVHGPPSPLVEDLELDHVRPLWSLHPEDRQDLRWWLPGNLQLLCRRCHRDKTAQEATRRAGLLAGTP